MQLRKILRVCILTAAVSVCVAAGAITVKAEEVKNEGTFEDSGTMARDLVPWRHSLPVSVSKGNQILAGVAKINKKKEIIVSSWGSYQMDQSLGWEAEIPLTHLNNAKDNYIALKSYEKGDVISLIKIPAADKAIKAVFDPISGTMKAGTGANIKAITLKPIGSYDGYQYRTKYSSWRPHDDIEGDGFPISHFKLHQKQGDTVYIRKNAQYGINEELPKVDKTETYTYGTQKQVVQPYVVSSLPTNEVKVKIPALPNGPKVPVDYTKGTVTLPKNSQYRVWNKDTLMGTGSTNDGTGIIDQPGTTTLTINAILETVNAGPLDTDVILEVRSKGTNKKPASKWTQIPLQKPAALTDIIKGTESIETAVVQENGTPVITFEYAKKGTRNVILIKNSSEVFDYDVAVAATAIAPESNTAAKKIGKGKSIVLSGASDGASVFIRKSGDRKKAQWVGGFTCLGTVNYP